MESGEEKKGLSFIQFLILSSIASGVPYSTEYCVEAVGVGWTLIGMVVLSIIFSWPTALISTELIALMPSNHGSIAWSYRAFSNWKLKVFGADIGDILGFLNAANLLLYYVFAFPMIPIIFVEYLETLIGDLTWWPKYCVKLGVIGFGFIVAIGNINVVGTTTNTLILVSLIPLLVGFIWDLPDIEISQWTQECSSYDIGLFLTNMTYLAAGYESLGALGGELNFGAKKLMIAYSVSIAISCLMTCIPVIAAATIPYSSCSSWYDGYFAVAYGDIWKPLYYMVLVSALICMMAFMMLCFVVGSRLVWAMAQKHILLLPDGTLILEAEMSLMPRGDGDGDGDEDGFGGGVDNADNVDSMNSSEYIEIPLGILPEKMGAMWQRTGAPVAGVSLFGVTSAILCTFIDYDEAIVLTFYAYVSTYFFVIAAFIVMRIYEPNAPRWYKVPGGDIGAWLVSILCFGLMALFAVWAFVSKVYIRYAAAIWAGCNVLFILYYYTVKKWLQSKWEEAAEREQYPPLIESGNEEEDKNGMEEHVAI